jgi:hypothetical protein
MAQRNQKSLANLSARMGKGRPKGSKNKKTRDEEEFCLGIVTSEPYRRNLRRRAESGRLAPAIEAMLWDRAYGKVRDTLSIDADIEPLIIDLLTSRAELDDDERTDD